MSIPTDSTGGQFAPETLVGKTVGARYEVRALVSVGGTSAIYSALDRVMGRSVALKVIVAPRSAMSPLDEERVQRFRREGKGLAQMRHPNIVSVHDSGVDGDSVHSYDIYYIAMDWLEGETLDRRLETSDRPMPWKEVLAVIRDVAEALDYAHDHELHFIHRDIKPGNIMLSEGRALLFDFGLVKALSVPTDGTKHHILAELRTLSQDGVTLGTPAYWSPEQINGEEVDRRTDVYALGGVLYHMLIGHPPYRAQDFVGLSSAHLHKPVPKPSSTNPALIAFDPIVERAMAKQPEDRYPSAGALARDLEDTMDRVPDPGMGRRLSAARRTARKAAWVLFSVMMSLAAIALFVGIGVRYLPWLRAFKSAPVGWRTASQGVSMHAIGDRAYAVTAVEPGSSLVVLKEGKIDHPHIVMQAELASGPAETAYGIVFNYVDDANYYVLSVTGTGEFGVWQRQGGNWRTPQGVESQWVSRKYILTDLPNRLEVTVEDDRAQLEINYQPLLENGIELATTGLGNVGVFVSTSGTAPDPQAVVQLDFSVRK